MTTRRFLLAVGSPIALLALLAALQHPVLFLYYLGLGVIAGGIGGYAAAHVFRGERDEARAESARLSREAESHVFKARLDAGQITALEAEAMRLHLALTEAQIAAGTVHVPLLRVVPASREVAANEWPAIMRAVEGEVSE